MKIISVIAVLTCFAILFAFRIFYHFELLSDSILALTALIIFWYTFETYQIRKTTEEQLQKTKRPIISYQVWRNPNDPFDTRFKILNQSDYPVAVRVKFNFQLNGTLLTDIWPSYDGIEYWNLQYHQIKEGHFGLLKLYLNSGLITEEQKNAINRFRRASLNGPKIISLPQELLDLPALTIEVKIYSENDLGMFLYYYPVFYKFDLKRLVWVPTITSKKPFWEFD